MPASALLPERPALDAAACQQALALVRQAIRCRWHPAENALLARLQQHFTAGQLEWACFVTLHLDDRLRGCIGCLQPDGPLSESLVHYAQAAAFADPRFPPLDEHDLSPCQVSVSLLGPLQPLPLSDRASLLRDLVVGEDGLWLSDARHRATFLPAVWRDIPEPAEFVRQLLRKGGWPAGSWPDGLQAWRYRVQEFGDSTDFGNS